MKTIKAILAGIGVMFGFVPICDGAVQIHNFNDLLAAIAQVESSGDPNAVNEKENAVGLYQIRPIYLKDVNRILGYQYFKLADRYDPEYSKQIVSAYLLYYGRNKSLEAMARIHNGGPKGYKRECTKQYWALIQRVMSEAGG